MSEIGRDRREDPPREEHRFGVDVDRIDELVDWALTKEWDADEGERIRREAWR